MDDRPKSKAQTQAGHDETLVVELLYGRRGTGKLPVYPPTGSLREREALEALCRLLNLAAAVDTRHRPLSAKVLRGLVHAFKPDGLYERQAVFKFRKGGRHDFMQDMVVDAFCTQLTNAGWPREAAVKATTDKFDMSRNAVFETRARVKRKLRRR